MREWANLILLSLSTPNLSIFVFSFLPLSLVYHFSFTFLYLSPFFHNLSLTYFHFFLLCIFSTLFNSSSFFLFLFLPQFRLHSSFSYNLYNPSSSIILSLLYLFVSSFFRFPSFSLFPFSLLPPLLPFFLHTSSFFRFLTPLSRPPSFCLSLSSSTLSPSLSLPLPFFLSPYHLPS